MGKSDGYTPDFKVDYLLDVLGFSTFNGKPTPATIVSLDTELRNNILTEIGLTILDTRNVMNIELGQYGRNWIDKMTHHHFFFPRIIDESKIKLPVMPNSISHPIEQYQARKQLIPLLNSFPEGEPVILIGHNIYSDLSHIKKLLGIDLSTTAYIPDVEFTMIVDTQDFAFVAQKLWNVDLPSLRLHQQLRYLGVDKQYRTHSSFGLVGGHAGCDDSVHEAYRVRDSSLKLVGEHGASNDSAYAMMLTLA